MQYLQAHLLLLGSRHQLSLGQSEDPRLHEQLDEHEVGQLQIVRSCLARRYGTGSQQPKDQ